jgi:hypothetical protein
MATLIGGDILFRKVGIRALVYYLDTGDCVFCNVECASNDDLHEDHCAFYGASREELIAICTEAQEFRR